MSTVLVTGGAGFIGSHLTDLLIEKGHTVVVLDKLTYAGDRRNLSAAEESGKLVFVHADVCNTDLVLNILKTNKIIEIFHLAAESHVDNSIHDPDTFVTTNVLGTISMLKAALSYWKEIDQIEHARFVHVSTDEVFGHLGEEDEPFSEETPYKPNSPYSASKAASDHFARAWHSTYGLPVITTNCSNNFGPRQHQEKLIPTIIRNALEEKPIPIYGTGKNIRDWLYVKDHCEGIYLALKKGRVGESYAFGGNNEMRNIQIAEMICAILDRQVPRQNKESYKDLLTFVEDRKGHDWRYAINTTKVEKELGFDPASHCDDHLLETVLYYSTKVDVANNEEWISIDLQTDKFIDLAQVDLNYDGFRKLAQNKHLSEHERLGFPDSYREGFADEILGDISDKLNLKNRTNGRLLDIGCGAGQLTYGLIGLCGEHKISIVLNDSPEMLNLIDQKENCDQVAGKFPDILDDLMAYSPNGYDAILCYSVLHYIVVDHNIFDFVDAVCLALADGGAALIGDIPNQSKRNRFFSSPTGIAYHKSFMNTKLPPIVEHSKVRPNSIDEAMLNAMIARAHSARCHAYIVPQPDTLPMHNRRDDILIQKV